MSTRLAVHLALTESHTAAAELVCWTESHTAAASSDARVGTLLGALGRWIEAHTHNVSVENNGCGSFDELRDMFAAQVEESDEENDATEEPAVRAGLLVTEHELASMQHAQRWLLYEATRAMTTARRDAVLDTALRARHGDFSTTAALAAVPAHATHEWAVVEEHVAGSADAVYKQVSADGVEVEVNLQTAEIFSAAGAVRSLPEEMVRDRDFRALFGDWVPQCTPIASREFMAEVEVHARQCVADDTVPTRSRRLSHACSQRRVSAFLGLFAAHQAS